MSDTTPTPNTSPLTKDNIKSVFFFNSMITPKIITFIYWLFLAAIVVAALGMIFTGNLVQAVGTLILGTLALRIWCELLIVLFKINENIQRIADR